MTVFVCVDDRGGVLFNKRRVSSDRAVTADILQYVSGHPLRIREYSAKLFGDDCALRIGDDYLAGAQAGDYVFLEEGISEQLLKRAVTIVVYHWNRLYPSDVKFPLDQLRKLGTLDSAAEFTGHSHDTITREVYIL